MREKERTQTNLSAEIISMGSLEEGLPKKGEISRTALEKEIMKSVECLPKLGSVKQVDKVLKAMSEEELKKVVPALECAKKAMQKANLQNVIGGASRCLSTIKNIVKEQQKEIGEILEDFYCNKLDWACFPAGTKVQTEQGLQVIEEIKVGDLVYARNEETLEVGYQLVEAVFQRSVHKLINLTMKGKRIQSTIEHPFWIEGKGYVEAEELEIGDKIVCFAEENIRIEEVEKIEIFLSEDSIVVYNLRIAEWHTYFVGELGIWVHNATNNYQDTIDALVAKLKEEKEIDENELNGQQQAINELVNKTLESMMPPKEKIKKAAEYAKDILGINVHYNNLEPETAEAMNIALEETFKRFPAVKEFFYFVGEAKEKAEIMTEDIEIREAYKKTLMLENKWLDEKHAENYMNNCCIENKMLVELIPKSNQYAHQQYTSAKPWSKYNGVCFNHAYERNIEKILKQLTKDVATQFHPKGCNTLKSVIDHEIGHMLDDILEISQLKAIKNIYKEVMKSNGDKMTMNLSRYAWDNKNSNPYREMIAEAWSEYCNNPEPRPIANTIGHIIEEQYKLKYGSIAKK